MNSPALHRRLTGTLLICAALFAAAPAEASFPGLNGKIVFVRSAAILTMDADGSNQTQLTPLPANADDSAPAWSPDGRQIAFQRTEYNFPDVTEAVYVVNEDGSNLTRLSDTGNVHDHDPAWSPDGQHIVFLRNSSPGGLYVMNKDGSDATLLTSAGGRDPDWSPDGTRIVFESSSGISLIDADGTDQRLLVPSALEDYMLYPHWSPDSTKIVVAHDTCMRHCDDQYNFYTLDPETGARTRMDSLSGNHAVFSPDGTKVVYPKEMGAPPINSGNLEILTANLDGTNVTRLTDNGGPDPNAPPGQGPGPPDFEPDWQRIINAYPRPKGATPLRASLVPAFAQCTTPNSQHGAPLSFASCTPPLQASGFLTVGTPPQDPANSIGSVTAKATATDVRLVVSVTDVRNKALLSDYTGELQTRLPLRITDKNSVATPGGEAAAATTQDGQFSFTVPCTVTSDTTIGSACSITTTANTVLPGAVTANLRTIWQLDQIAVYDGGPDGDAETPGGNTLFMNQGIFVP